MNNPLSMRASVVLAMAILSQARGAAAQDAERVACSDLAQAVGADVFGRLLVGGTAYDNRIVHWEGGGHAHFGDFAVSRLLGNGSVDPTFGEGGTVIRHLEDFDDVLEVLPRTGYVDVAGTTAALVADRRGPRDVVVYRLDARGRASASFHGGGLVRLDLGGDETVAALTPAPFGGVYVLGTTSAEGKADGFVARYTRAGSLDTSFGQAGIVRLDFGSDGDEVVGGRALLGSLVVAGRTALDGESAAVVVKLNERGEFVTEFGDHGRATARIGGAPASGGASSHSLFGGSAVSLVKTVAEGATRSATVVFDPWGRVRTHDGDTTFEVDAPTGVSDSIGATERFWGSLYLAGATYPESFATGDAFITRIDDGGLPSAEFGGLISEHFELEYAAYNDLVVDARGVVAAGWEFSESKQGLPRSDALLVRYGHDGMLDPRFGDNGVVLHDFRGGEAVCGPLTIVGEDDHGHDH